MPSSFQVHTVLPHAIPAPSVVLDEGTFLPLTNAEGLQALLRPCWDSWFRQQTTGVYPFTFMRPDSKNQGGINMPLQMIQWWVKIGIVGENKQISRKAVQEAMSLARPPSCIKDKQLNSKMLLSTAFNKKIYSALCDFRRQRMESRLEQDVIWQIFSHKGIITFRLGKWVLRQWNVKPGQPTLLEAYSFSLTFILVSTQGEVGRHPLAGWKSIRVFKHLLWISKQKYKDKANTMAHNPAARVNARKRIQTKQKVYKKELLFPLVSNCLPSMPPVLVISLHPSKKWKLSQWDRSRHTRENNLKKEKGSVIPNAGQCREIKTLQHCWSKGKMVSTFWKIVWQFFIQLNTDLLNDPEITLLGI